MRLKGPAAYGQSARAHDWLRDLFGSAFHCQFAGPHAPDALARARSPRWENEHPILCQVLADLAQLEMLATGRVPEHLLSPVGMALSLTEAQALAADARLSLDTLGAIDFLSARQLLFAGLHDLTATA